MKGSRQATVTQQEVIVGQTLTVNLTLDLGSMSETVEVKVAAGAELQTENATMGSTVTGDMLLAMPNLNRDATSLLTELGLHPRQDHTNHRACRVYVLHAMAERAQPHGVQRSRPIRFCWTGPTEPYSFWRAEQPVQQPAED